MQSSSKIVTTSKPTPNCIIYLLGVYMFQTVCIIMWFLCRWGFTFYHKSDKLSGYWIYRFLNECFCPLTLSLLWRCWSGIRNGILPVKNILSVMPKGFPAGDPRLLGVISEKIDQLNKNW